MISLHVKRYAGAFQVNTVLSNYYYVAKALCIVIGCSLTLLYECKIHIAVFRNGKKSLQWGEILRLAPAMEKEVDYPATSHTLAVLHDTKGQSMLCTKTAVIASYLAPDPPRPQLHGGSDLEQGSTELWVPS